MKGIITDVQRFSVHDGPGIRTLIFLKGCPLFCPWCCNPETQAKTPEIAFFDFKCIQCDNCVKVCSESAILKSGSQRIDRAKCTLCGACVQECPSGALKIRGELMSVEEVYEIIEKDRIFYEKSGGGVTFSGGEPLVQHEFLREMLEMSKNNGLHTAVETSGFADRPIFEKVMGKVDLFLYDLKIMDNGKHREIVGTGNEPVVENLQKLAGSGKNVIVRIPVVPGFTMNGNNMTEIFAFVASLKEINTVHLLPYHKYGKSKYRFIGRNCELENTEAPDGEEMAKIAESAQSYGLKCIIGG
jgi:pyruvate formate lyase activating enzyme